MDIAYRDEVTGLTNRHGWNAFIEKVKSSVKSIMPASIVVVDLDLLGITNKLFTHEAGDNSLIIIAEAAKQTLREDDFVSVVLGNSDENSVIARSGDKGDEFRLSLPNTDEEGAVVVIERLRSSIDEIMQERKNKGDDEYLSFVGISAGSSQLVDSGDFKRDVKVALKAADTKMHQDKTLKRHDIDEKYDINK